MIFEQTSKFRKDFKNLSENDKKSFENSISTIEQGLLGNLTYKKYHKLRPLKGHNGLYEGHVTGNNKLVFVFHYDIDENEETICFLRRIGNHDVYRSP